MITGFIVSPRHNQPWFSNLTSMWFIGPPVLLFFLDCPLLSYFIPLLFLSFLAAIIHTHRLEWGVLITVTVTHSGCRSEVRWPGIWSGTKDSANKHCEITKQNSVTFQYILGYIFQFFPDVLLQCVCFQKQQINVAWRFIPPIHQTGSPLLIMSILNSAN